MYFQIYARRLTSMQYVEYKSLFTVNECLNILTRSDPCKYLHLCLDKLKPLSKLTNSKCLSNVA